jgi:hypothetical protein
MIRVVKIGFIVLKKERLKIHYPYIPIGSDNGSNPFIEATYRDSFGGIEEIDF